MKFLSTLTVAASLVMVSCVRAAAACPGGLLSADQAVRMQKQIFSALEHESRPAWDALITPDFLAFERGKAYDGAEFFALIASAHKAGVKLSWSVTDQRVEADCGLAVMSYINLGSVAAPGEAPGTARWLETVAFRKDAKGWRAFLITSMPVAEGSR